MGGFFGITSREDCLNEVFFGVDYHSHLGTKTGGIAAYDKEIGLQRQIHKINNSPFRTKFEHVFEDMKGTAAIGCINDGDPQPLLVRTGLGVFAICIIGVINNAQELIDKHMFEVGGHYEAMTGGKINSPMSGNTAAAPAPRQGELKPEMPQATVHERTINIPDFLKR